MEPCADELGQKLHEDGLRLTKQRRVILDVLQDTMEHPDAAWIYEQVRRHIPNVSLGTIYRNLGVLEDQGLVRVLRYGRFRRYDGNLSRHYHLACLGCGAVYDVDLPWQEGLKRRVEQEGYQVLYHRLEFYGYCPVCLSCGMPTEVPGGGDEAG